MEPNNTASSQVLHDFSPRFRVYADGRVERLRTINIILPAPSHDPITGIQSKDVTISPVTGVSARLFLPPNPTHKLPLLIYIHGGAFCLQSAFSSTFHHYVSSLALEANAIAVSVDYRLAPEHPIPACYEDSWSVIQWVFSHANADGPESWLNRHADFSGVFLAGDSAGSNIAHDMAIRAGFDGGHVGGGVKFLGVVLVHPFFGSDQPDRLWMFLCPDTSGVNDPRLNPGADLTRLSRLGCSKVLVCVAEEDQFRERVLSYCEGLKESGWSGEVEIVETKGEDHVFHLFNPNSENAATLLKRVALFVNRV
ncbi:hypothetical protein Ancab_039307 [Ancistrocladus abbreviatus]